MFQLKADYKDYESKTLRLPSVLVKELSEKADENHISFNKAVIQCIEYALSNLPESKDKTE
ncbi:MAG: hypothetical protein IJ336_01725 [Lachnospiraceae bacterium]|nr:hypothetical protein [Lachnospiraceae bacterium]